MWRIMRGRCANAARISLVIYGGKLLRRQKQKIDGNASLDGRIN